MSTPDRTTRPAAISPRPALIPLGRHDARPPFALNRPVTLIGSRHRAHIRLESDEVSRSHAAVVNVGGRVLIRDFASRTHVYVNGRQVQEAELADGDHVNIGRFALRFVADDEPAPLPVGEHAGNGTATLSGEGLDPAGVPLNGTICVVGCRPGVDLVLRGSDVSFAHALIFNEGGRHVVRDLGSRTGTFVDGAAAEGDVELRTGSVIRIGSYRLRYTAAGEAAGGEGAPPAREPRTAAPIAPAPVLPEMNAAAETWFPPAAVVMPAKEQRPTPAPREAPQPRRAVAAPVAKVTKAPPVKAAPEVALVPPPAAPAPPVVEPPPVVAEAIDEVSDFIKPPGDPQGVTGIPAEAPGPVVGSGGAEEDTSEGYPSIGLAYVGQTLVDEVVVPAMRTEPPMLVIASVSDAPRAWPRVPPPDKQPAAEAEAAPPKDAAPVTASTDAALDEEVDDGLDAGLDDDEVDVEPDDIGAVIEALEGHQNRTADAATDAADIDPFSHLAVDAEPEVEAPYAAEDVAADETFAAPVEKEWVEPAVVPPAVRPAPVAPPPAPAKVAAPAAVPPAAPKMRPLVREEPPAPVPPPNWGVLAKALAMAEVPHDHAPVATGEDEEVRPRRGRFWLKLLVAVVLLSAVGGAALVYFKPDTLAALKGYF